jgi:hypothetical protein
MLMRQMPPSAAQAPPRCRSISLTIPETLLATANEVIE